MTHLVALDDLSPEVRDMLTSPIKGTDVFTPDCEDYAGACAEYGLPVEPHGWGVLHLRHADGRMWSLASPDPHYVLLIGEAATAELDDVTLHLDRFAEWGRGWPTSAAAWTV